MNYLKKLMKVSVAVCMFALCLCICQKVASAGEGKIVQIEAEKMLSAALGDDGVVYTWGNNFYGSLGDGTNSNRWEVREALIRDVKSISIKGWTMYALKNDGTVWTWGLKNPNNSSDGAVNTPKKIEGLGTISQIVDDYFVQTNGVIIDYNAAKAYNGLKNPKTICGNCILGSDGIIYKFGEGYSKPVAEPYLNNVVDLDYGNGVYIACTEDGRVFTWGNGYLGNGMKVYSSWPVGLSISSNKIRKVAAGDNMLLALDDSGQIWQWGKNPLGYDLFGNNVEELLSPTKVKSNISFVDISSGNEHNLAIDVNGEVYEWGYIRYGEFGNDRLHTKTVPEKLVTVRSNISFDAARDFGDSTWVDCAISSPGEMRYYKFTPNESTYYEFGTKGNKDTYGYLYDSTGKQIASNDDGRGAGASDYNYDFYIKQYLTKGKTYYIGVRMFSSSTTGKFSVYKRFYDDFVNKYNDEKITTYVEDAYAESRMTIDGKFDYIGDVDVIKFVPYRDEWYSFKTATDYNTVGTLLDENGKVLIESDNATCICLCDNKMSKLDYYISYRLKAGKAYYLTSKANVSGMTYEIVINRFSDDYVDDINDVTEFDFNFRAEATSLARGGYINCEGDKDVIGITVKQSQIYNIKSSGVKGLKGILYDEAGKEIACVGNSSATSADGGFEKQYALEANKNYYLKVYLTDHICGTKLYRIVFERAKSISNTLETSDKVSALDNINCRLDYAGDVDYIPIDILEGGIYSIESQSNIDLEGVLYNKDLYAVNGNGNANSNVITISANNKDFYMETNLQPGRYWLRVNEENASNTVGAYKVYVRKLYELTIDNYYDYCFGMRYDSYGSPDALITQSLKEAEKFYKKEFNIKLIYGAPQYRQSIYDQCAAASGYDIYSECKHKDKDKELLWHTEYYEDYEEFINSGYNNSSDKRIFVLWTGHNTYDENILYNKSDVYEEEEYVPEDEDDEYEKAAYGIYIQTQDRLLHSSILIRKIANILGAADHYHELQLEGDDEDGYSYECYNELDCDACNPSNGRSGGCMLGTYGYNSNTTSICSICRGEIVAHIRSHHALIE